MGLGRVTLELLRPNIEASAAAESTVVSPEVLLSDQEFKALANSIPQIVWISGPKGGEPLFLNDKYYEYTGLPTSISGLEGWNLVVHPDDRAEAYKGWEAAICTCKPWICELRLKNAAGEYRWHLSRCIPIFGPAGSVEHWVATSTDIDDQKQAEAVLERERRRSAFLLELNDLSRSARNPDEIVQTMLKATAEHLDANRCSYIEADFETDRLLLESSYSRGVAPIKDLARLSDFGGPTEEMLSGRPAVVEDVQTDERIAAASRSAFGQIEVQAAIIVPVLTDKEITAFFGVSCKHPRKWTDDEIGLIQELAGRIWQAVQQARAASEIIKLNAELEQRVEERTTELASALHQLEAFTYTASHDLRTPLRGVIATSRILLEDYGKALPKEACDLLKSQADSATRMATLIDQLLRFARIGRQGIARECLDLSALALEAATDVDAEANGVELHVQPNLKDEGDPRLVKLVFANLLENACKFSPGGGKVCVYRLHGQGSPYVVEDEGVGFDMQFADKIWAPFSRLVRDDEFPGTGIGLANVQRIIERHGGRVWAESVPGKGSRFYFTLS